MVDVRLKLALDILSTHRKKTAQKDNSKGQHKRTVQKDSTKRQHKQTAQTAPRGNLCALTSL